MKPQMVSLDFFKTVFEQNITVLLNWDALSHSRAQARVNVKLLTSREELENLYTPWHLNAQQQEVGYDGTTDAPLKISQVQTSLSSLNPKRQKAITELAQSFSQYTKAVEFYVPLYKFSESQYFVLDANHKLSALYMSAVPFKIIAFVVEAPATTDILQDLENLI